MVDARELWLYCSQISQNTPIAPGASGEILVSFDSNNKPNMQQKTVTISANTSSGHFE